MSAHTIARTFIDIPDTRLPTVIRADLSQRVGEATRIVEASGRLADHPTAGAPAAARPRAGANPHPSPLPPLAPPVPPMSPPRMRGKSADNATTVVLSSEAASSNAPSPVAEGSVRPPLPVGYEIARYRIENALAAGGFSLTYRARDLNLDRRIVLKELFVADHCERETSLAIRPRSNGNSEKAFRWASYYFSQEARITADLRHDGIVRLNDFFKTNGTAYIAYELLEGADLASFCVGRRHDIDHATALDVMRRCADALQYVHERGFLHRDVKPSNIFMLAQRPRPILIDFGSATQMGGRQTDEFLALSDGFSPPELYERGASQDARSDIYSLCATMFWVLTGRPPESAPGRRQREATDPLSMIMPRHPRIGERLAKVIDTGMRPDIRGRYPDVPALLDDLFPRVMISASGYLGEPRGRKVFLSYRREDSMHFSGRLLDFLELRFGAGEVFFDVESIPAGIDFWDHIKSQLQLCAVLVVVIGPGWLESLRRRRRRWYSVRHQEDFVEAEVRAAIDMQLPILPVLFDGAAMPAERDLPKALRPLCGLNAAIIGGGKQFRQGAESVCDQISSIRADVDSGGHAPAFGPLRGRGPRPS